MHRHVVYADDGLCRVAGRSPFPASLLPQMRRRSTLEEFQPECTGTSMRVFLLQRLRERDGGLVATRSRASPPTLNVLTVELEKGEPPTFFWKQKLPTFTWQLRRRREVERRSRSCFHCEDRTLRGHGVLLLSTLSVVSPISSFRRRFSCTIRR